MDAELTALPSGPQLAAVQFQPAGTIHRFNSGRLSLKLGDQVVVETERGRRLAMVIALPRPATAGELGTRWPRILKLADSSDLDRDDRTRRRDREAVVLCLQQIRDRQLPMKLLGAESTPDGGKVVFCFAAEGRVDFRELVRALAHQLHTRVEMKQVGARDEAKALGAVASCGRELCCSSWLRQPGGVSLKMAKAQGLSPHPSRLAGMCGRLKCCLKYEYETYLALGRALPALGVSVMSVKGDGLVVRQNLLAQTVTIRGADGAEAEVTLEDLVERTAQ